ncbi:MAG TPA: hypothetical protein DCR48_02580 [Flavobacteriales bacterium]|nr:hypothetical protein [Flavobacteriales bacterium]
MKLITETLKKRFAEVGRQEGSKDPIVVAKFFNPMGSGNWWATEYDPERNVCFGYVSGLQFDEWGYFSIEELEALKLPFGLTIERNIHFGEQPMSKAIPQALIDLGYI